MLVTEYASEESEYNNSFLYIEVLIDTFNYISTYFPHLNYTSMVMLFIINLQITNLLLKKAIKLSQTYE